MSFALKELNQMYSSEEIKSLVYYLFEEYLSVNKTDYILNSNKTMSESDLLKFNFAIKDLKRGKPLQYILSYTYFCNEKFFVNEHTLIPRPETEELVQHIINVEKDKKGLHILDIGTGTACIPISLAQQMPKHYYHALDFREEIIQLAKKNARFHNKIIQFQLMDILKNTTDKLGTFDIIISNPPYVLESEKQEMHINVLKYEPESALYVKDHQALLFYKKIAQVATKSLCKNGRLYFEINENQAKNIQNLLKKFGFTEIKIFQDIHGKDRFMSSVLSL